MRLQRDEIRQKTIRSLHTLLMREREGAYNEEDNAKCSYAK